MYKNCIVRTPSKSISEGIADYTNEGKPDWELALKQHKKYIQTLEKVGVKVHVLPPLEDFPDSCFVEDVAILLDKIAIITNPKTKSRNGEKKEIYQIIRNFYNDNHIFYIEEPGTLEGGDVMIVGHHLYIGLSTRTNTQGAKQLIDIITQYGYSGSTVEVKNNLHLKTAINYLENLNILAADEFIHHPTFRNFRNYNVPANEAYACNSIWMNGYVITPAGYPSVEEKIKQLGYKVLTVDMSEFRKIDGGLSCLSLRF